MEIKRRPVTKEMRFPNLGKLFTPTVDAATATTAKSVLTEPGLQKTGKVFSTNHLGWIIPVFTILGAGLMLVYLKNKIKNEKTAAAELEKYFEMVKTYAKMDLGSETQNVDSNTPTTFRT